MEVLVETGRGTCLGTCGGTCRDTCVHTDMKKMLVIMKSNHPCNMIFVHSNITHYYLDFMLINLHRYPHQSWIAITIITHIKHQCRAHCEINLYGSHFPPAVWQMIRHQFINVLCCQSPISSLWQVPHIITRNCYNTLAECIKLIIKLEMSSSYNP